MTADEHPHQRLQRFARIRRLKLLLRYMPRRARFHTYPLVGRFASFARARSYLWSFRYENIRPSFYLGSILTLIPIPAQLLISFFLCLGFRANFMVMGGLQFVSNPATSVPFLLGTYKLGSMVLNVTGISASKSAEIVTMDMDLSQPMPFAGAHTPAEAPSPPETIAAHQAPKKTWTDRIYELFGDMLPPRGQPMSAQDWFRLLGHLFGSLLIGAILAGLAVGALMDLLWRYLMKSAAKLRAVRHPVTATVTPHDNPPPPAS
jgi:uncharacterized protein (DUF2062 family)